MWRAAGLTIVAVIALVGVTLSQPGTGTVYGLAGQAARGHLEAMYGARGAMNRRLPRLSGGLVNTALEAFRSHPWGGHGAPIISAPGCDSRTSFGDTRVNQDCSLRRQSAGAIAVNPTNPNNVIAAQNDSSIGWNHCGYDYSLDGGETWGGGTPPFFERGNHPVSGHTVEGGQGTLHTYDAASDPSIAFDSRGNAYLSCVLFDITDPANGILVAHSPAAVDGSFYDTVPAYSGSGTDPATNVVIEDNSSNATADEPKIAADSYASSAYRDHVYVTWTEFIASPLCTQGGVCSSPIYFAGSSNGGQTWTKPIEISGNSRALCSAGNLFDLKRKPHDCNFDEGSDPFVLPNGDIVVLFNNSNTAGVNVNNQILAVVSKNAGATWSRPALVGSDVVTREPQCNVGDGNGPEECVPGPFVRGNDDPLGTVDPSNGHLYAVWDDYSSGRYVIHMSTSTNSGSVWAENRTVLGPASLDSYMPSIAVSPTLHDLAIGYYGSGRVAKEGHSGLFRRGIGGVGGEPSRYYVTTAASLGGPWHTRPVSPAFPAPNGAQAGYNGDYSGIVMSGAAAHPIWSDTRNTYSTAAGRFDDEDVFTTSVGLGVSPSPVPAQRGIEPGRSLTEEAP